MSELMNLDPCAVCVAVHEALQYPCPICGAEAEACCTEDGEDLPVYVAHIGRATGGLDIMVEHTGTFDTDGGAILREVEN